MNLTDIAKKILNEDTWGNNPSAAAPQAPGRSPTATQPPASPNAKMIDISDTFKNFKLSLEKQEDAAVKKLVDELSKQFLKKNVVVKYYIVFSGKEGNEAEPEYYLDDSQIEVDGYGQEAPTMQSSLGKGQVGGIKYPQTMGIASKRNIVPQK